MWKEFKEFALRGNVVDMAVGIIIGVAFGTIAKSLIADILMPPVGLLLGGVDFNNLFILLKDGAEVPPPYFSLAEAQAAGAVVMSYGVFFNNVLAFVTVALAVFFIVKGINELKREREEIPEEEPTIKDCPFCFSKISLSATKCAYCTSDLTEKVEGGI